MQRCIHPDMWQDERVASMTAAERLLFIGLITIADDEGRLPAALSYIQGRLYPHDSKVTPEYIQKWLSALLEKNKNILLYKNGGGLDYLALLNWKKYQKVAKPTPSRIPAPHPEVVAKHLALVTQPELLGGHEERAIAICLETLQTVANYPFNASTDARMVQTLLRDFPKVDVPQRLQDWAAYKLDKPIIAGTSPRAQLRTWMRKGTEFAERDAAKTGNITSLPSWREVIADRRKEREAERGKPVSA